jgi:methylenetetrahydrofolate dehydrogenase (NADP+)/methenyltetrahydrofolate cyclohydrolase
MKMILLNGKTVSDSRLQKLKELATEEFSVSNRRPGLAVIRVGDDPASKIYVGRKVKACQDAGFNSFECLLPSHVSQEELIRRIKELNSRSDTHGILVQLPLPKHIQEGSVISSISPEKDVDGFHPMNLGMLVAGEQTMIPCTPLGIMTLLNEYGIGLKGRRAIVIGRSRIVGRPISLLLDQADATVTVVHSQTPHPETLCREADIVVAAAGRAGLVTASWIKPGAVVIDVGINRLASGKIVGDVDFESVAKLASHLTPVPGGVGPMTICSLLENTWKSFKNLSSNG